MVYLQFRGLRHSHNAIHCRDVVADFDATCDDLDFDKIPIPDLYGTNGKMEENYHPSCIHHITLARGHLLRQGKDDVVPTDSLPPKRPRPSIGIGTGHHRYGSVCEMERHNVGLRSKARKLEDRRWQREPSVIQILCKCNAVHVHVPILSHSTLSISFDRIRFPMHIPWPLYEAGPGLPARRRLADSLSMDKNFFLTPNYHVFSARE